MQKSSLVSIPMSENATQIQYAWKYYDHVWSSQFFLIIQKKNSKAKVVILNIVFFCVMNKVLSQFYVTDLVVTND